MKFVIVGDVHIADVAPSTRKDDYKNTVLGKLKFIAGYVNENNVDGVLFVGDLFHKKIPFHNSHSLLSQLISLFESVTAPVYIIPGNHDIHGNMSSFENQPLNVLVQAGVVNLLDGNEPVLFKGDDMFSVSLNGVPFSPLLDSKNAANLYELKHHIFANMKISMFHQMVLPDGKKFFDDYINFSDLANINADVVVCGHYHEGFTPSVVLQSSKWFINPGSITRGTAEQTNFEKSPKFLELDVSDKRLTYSEILIPVIPANECFDFTVIERNKRKKDMHEFMDGLTEMESQSLSTQEPSGIMNALKVLGMEKRLEPIAQRYLDEAYANFV